MPKVMERFYLLLISTRYTDYSRSSKTKYSLQVEYILSRTVEEDLLELQRSCQCEIYTGE